MQCGVLRCPQEVLVRVRGFSVYCNLYAAILSVFLEWKYVDLATKCNRVTMSSTMKLVRFFRRSCMMCRVTSTGVLVNKDTTLCDMSISSFATVMFLRSCASSFENRSFVRLYYTNYMKVSVAATWGSALLTFLPLLLQLQPSHHHSSHVFGI